METNVKASGPGRGWRGDSARHAEAGRKGGRSVSQNRQHMAEIGRKGGMALSRNREYMVEIGRRGGQAMRNKVADTKK